MLIKIFENTFQQNTMQQNIKKTLSHGKSPNRNKENSGRPRTTRSEENIKCGRNMIENHQEIFLQE